MTTQTRRSFLATLGAAALGVAATDADAATTILLKRRKLDKVGIQLYSVRDLMKADMPGTLARVAAVGYKEVEFAGYFDRTPAQVRQLLKQNGLTSPSSHLPWEAFQNSEKTFADAKAIGNHWATLPWVPEEKRKTVDDWKGIAAQFNKFGAQAKSAGLRFAYHNHNFELAPIGCSLKSKCASNRPSSLPPNPSHSTTPMPHSPRSSTNSVRKRDCPFRSIPMA